MIIPSRTYEISMSENKDWRFNHELQRLCHWPRRQLSWHVILLGLSAQI
jgi:hypothetical protein